MLRMTLALAGLLVLAPAAMAQQSADSASEMEWPAIGSTAPNFELPNILDENNGTVSLSGTLDGKELAVVIWNSVTCPICVPYDAILPGISEAYADKGVAFIGINSNSTESDDQVAQHLTDAGFNFPVLRDAGNEVADRYGASVTPEVYIVDSDMRLRYHGRINDNPRDEAAAENHDLKNALEALVAGNEPPVTVTLARGCTIKRVRN